MGNRSGIGNRSLGGNSINVGNHQINIANNSYRPSFYNHPFYHGYWNGNWGGGWGGWGPGLGYGYGGWGPGWGWGWGGFWGRPFGWGLGAWGLGSLLYNSGYLGYWNPYYGSSYAGVYDYSQPIPVDYGATYAVGNDPSQNPADAMLTDAIAAFKQGDYDASLDIVNKAIGQYPSDSVLHEFRALVLFAKADYQQAAATLHSVLAVGPGWDWTTLSSLYPSLAIYADQLRALESFVVNHPQDGAARFVVAYHYMSAGHRDAARRQLEQVVQLVSNDRVAADLLRMLTPADQSQAPPGIAGAPGPTPHPPDESSPSAAARASTPSEKAIDPAMLVGKWKATRDDGSKFDLTLRDNSTFIWKFSPPKGESNEFSGKYTVEGNVLALERKEGGSMVGEVAPRSEREFNFKALGAPPEDAGLDFVR